MLYTTLNILKSKKLILHSQNAIKKGVSCVSKILELVNLISYVKHENKELHIALIDIIKAYDETSFDAFEDVFDFFGIPNNIELNKKLTHNSTRVI